MAKAVAETEAKGYLIRIEALESAFDNKVLASARKQTVA